MRNSKKDVSRALLEQEDELFALRKENRKSKEEIENLEVELQRLKRENYDLKSDIKILKKRIQEFGHLDQAASDFEKQNKRLRAAEHELIENDKLLQRFEDELDRKNRRIEDLTVKLGSRNEEIHQLKFMLNEYQKKKNKVVSNNTKVTVLMKEKETIFIEYENLQEENRQLKKKMKQLEKENEKLRNKASNKPHTSPRQTNVSFDSMGDESERIKQLELNLAELLALIEKLRKENNDWKIKYENAMKEVRLWKKRRNQIADELDETQVLLEQKKEEIMRKIFHISMLSVKLSVTMFALEHRVKLYDSLKKKK